MSGSESSAPANAARAPEADAPLSFAVHSLPLDVPAQRTARGRWVMLAILAVCAAPVIASYAAYFGGLRPQGRTNYSELIPPRAIPANLPLVALSGETVSPLSLRDQWLLVIVAGGACDTRCERQLWLQRQLHELLGREKDRVDKVWLVDDAAPVRPETLAAIVAASGPTGGFGVPRVLRVDPKALAGWLQAAEGHPLEDHFYVVDPHGDWMMRSPPDANPSKLKGDIEKLLRASAGWDKAGR